MYKKHFKRWDKSYPIEYQIQTIQKGQNLPTVSVLVDSMFHAELKNRILTSGHDLDHIKGDLIFDLTNGTELYQMINGKDQTLKENDIFLKDQERILANVLFGPAKSTTINPRTKNVLYLAWSPDRLNASEIEYHLNDIYENVSLVLGNVDSKIKIH